MKNLDMRSLKVCLIIIFVAVLALGLLASADWQNQQIQVGALCYHNFFTDEDLENGYEADKYSIHIDEFEAHLQYLKKNNIRAISISELTAFTKGKIDLPKKCILITVDDCSRSFYELAFPLLKKYGMVVNMAVIGDRTDLADATTSWAEKYCTWSEVKELSESGVVEIGSHTYNLHTTAKGRTGTMLLSSEGTATYKKLLVNDMQPLNEKIQEYCGYKPAFFAYPYYAISMASVPTLRDELGYRFLFVGNNDSSFRYCGEAIHETSYNPFTKGKTPESCLIKRFSPETGDDFAALMKQIFAACIGKVATCIP